MAYTPNTATGQLCRLGYYLRSFLPSPRTRYLLLTFLLTRLNHRWQTFMRYFFPVIKALPLKCSEYFPGLVLKCLAIHTAVDALKISNTLWTHNGKIKTMGLLKFNTFKPGFQSHQLNMHHKHQSCTFGPV